VGGDGGVDFSAADTDTVHGLSTGVRCDAAVPSGIYPCRGVQDGGGNTCYWPDRHLLTAGLSPITLRMSSSVPLVVVTLSSPNSLRKPCAAIFTM
jgi:hypothetical protein